MRSASTLCQPDKYFKAYEKGKNAAKKGQYYSNPYYNGVSDVEEFDGYADGFHDNYKGTYVEFSHEGGPIERRYFKTESCAINWALSFKGAQIRTK